ncbi:MAG: DUF1298 domain-containing protein [Actinobacteria bacterium]|nr:DUF1298 domain-containing protein [Actinomycetota bacterium]
MAERALGSEQRMSDAEALMWKLEKDPSLRSTFLSISFLDRPPSFEGFRRRMAAAVAGLPRLRQKVTPAPAGLAPPAWVDDPSFDLDFHVRRLGLPSPGTERQLLDLAAVELQDPFDGTRPLWRYTIVEGLSGGRAALLAKMHHTVSDGEGGLRLSAMFVDLERDAPDPPAPEPGPVAEPGGLAEGSAVAEALAHGLRRQLGIGWRLANTTVEALLQPERLQALAAEAPEILRSVLRQMAVSDQARSPLWAGRRSLRRHFEILSVDLGQLKAVSNALGGSINDGFVCGVAGGAAAYHRAKGVEVDELRVSMPVSTRVDSSPGGNAFTPTRALVPAGILDPVERFEVTHQRLDATRRERTVGMTDTFAAILNALPTAMAVNLARQQVETVDFATSNLRGAPWDLFVAGAEVLGTHPMGPTGGTAFNATVLSYRGSLDMGINVDAAAVDDPALLRDCIAGSFAELVALKG